MNEKAALDCERLRVLAERVVAANYETSGLDSLAKAPLWQAIADLEKALREMGAFHV